MYFSDFFENIPQHSRIPRRRAVRKAFRLPKKLSSLDNALKYSADGGSICLKAQRSGKRTEITVSNTVGAAQDIDTARLFDRFYRADESHSGTVSGTGIGLSIAKATVQAHGGKISAKKSNDTILFQVLL